MIELSIALAIAAVMFSAAVFSIGALTGTKAKTAAAELGGVIRSLYDTAAISGKTCRLVFQLAGENEDDGVTQYWAECASGNITARKDRDAELKDADHQDPPDQRSKKENDRFRSFGGSDEPSTPHPKLRPASCPRR
jgi:general secretion pathway protein H